MPGLAGRADLDVISSGLPLLSDEWPWSVAPDSSTKGAEPVRFSAAHTESTMTADPQATPDDRIPELYADGILDIGFGNGMLRIDLFSLSATCRDGNGQPLPAIRQRVVMNLNGFLASLAAMEGMRQRLEAAGVPMGGGPAFPSSAPQPAADPIPAPVAPKSPNFS